MRAAPQGLLCPVQVPVWRRGFFLGVSHFLQERRDGLAALISNPMYLTLIKINTVHQPATFPFSIIY